MSRIALVISLISLVACVGSAGSPDPAGPTASVLSVPEGSRELEHTMVTAAERTGRLRVERELTIVEAFDIPLYRVSGIAMAANGELFVLDAGNHRVIVVDKQGNALRQFGRSGQGPGEFQAPVAIAIVGDRVAVYQRRQRRINLYGTAGEHIDDHVLEESLGSGEMIGIDDGLLVVNATGTPVPIRPGLGVSRTPWFIGVYSPQGQERTRLVETEDMARARYLTRAVAGWFPIAAPHPRAALAADGLAYATTGAEYQILALQSSGRPRWVINVGWVPPEITETQKNTIIDAFLAEHSGDSFVETDWPERFAAIVNLEVDGTGNPHVFPYDLDAYFETDIEQRPPAGPVPVDVYSPDGERLFAGLSELSSWDAQQGNRVCRVEAEREEVACYRLAVPGER